MGIPEYVATPPVQLVRTYSSPPQRPGSWHADRPGDLEGRQPSGEMFGFQGPDQGYALTLAEHLRGSLQLTRGEHADDALSGAAAVATRRASRFGRAPVLADVKVGLAIWGFLHASPPEDLVEFRRAMFAGIHHAHAYEHRRAVVDAVDGDALGQPPDRIIELAADDWRSLISV